MNFKEINLIVDGLARLIFTWNDLKSENSYINLIGMRSDHQKNKQNFNADIYSDFWSDFNDGVFFREAYCDFSFSENNTFYGYGLTISIFFIFE